MIEKRQIIDDIRRFNIGVKTRFLAQFDEAALKQYLESLQAAHAKHERMKVLCPRPERKLRMAS